MSVFVLVTGTLFKDPEQKTSSKSGRAFVSAVVKIGGENNDAEFWSVTAFSQSAQSELLRLNAGDAVSVLGKAKLELWQRDGGEVKISRSLFADQALALKAPPRERRAKAKAETPLLDQASKQQPTTTDPDLDDPIPF
jgi:single-stranded DNA-binding protein